MKRDCPTHDQLRRLLDSGAASTVTGGETVWREHVNQCAVCQRALERITAAEWSDLADFGPVDGSSGALQRVMNAVVEQAGATRTQAPADDEIRFPGPPGPKAPLGRLGSYRIESRMAEGAQGILFRAWDERLQRTVAIKVLRHAANVSPTMRERFAREARAAAALNDERIVRIHEIGSEPDFPPFIVMEHVPGKSLRQLMESGSPAFRDSAAWVRDAALGLAAAHDAGVIHRDVKPSNLLLDERKGLVRLTDFGLALEVAETVRMTQEGMLAGTPAYMSPEQLNQPAGVDRRTDIYSLGVVLYELLAGQAPFRGNLRMTLLQVAHDDPRPPRQFNDEVPRDLETICLKAMAREPAGRFASGRELAAELDRWLEGVPILSRPAGKFERLARWSFRRPVVALLAAFSALLLITLGVVLALANRGLARSAKLAGSHAAAASRQRDAALETLRQLVFQLQDGFDEEVIDLDVLQKNALQIALDGLARLRTEADQAGATGIESAEAFRRMGEILDRLDQLDDARECLARAETGFRQSAQSPGDQRRALSGLIETLWARHDLEVDLDRDGKAHAALVTATRAARELVQTQDGASSRLLLGQALMYEARGLVDRLADAHADGLNDNPAGNRLEEHLDRPLAGPLASQAGKLLSEARELLDPLAREMGPEAEPAWEAWLEATGLLATLAGFRDQPEKERELLGEAAAAAKTIAPEVLGNPAARQIALALELRLLEAIRRDGNEEGAAVVRDRISAALAAVRKSATDDQAGFLAALEFHDGLRDQLIADADWQGLDFFERARLELVDARLARVAGDEQALLARAACCLELADAASLLDQPPSRVRRAYRDSLDQYRELSGRSGFGEDHWAGYLNAVLSAAEFEQDIDGNGLEQLLREAQSVRERIAGRFPQAIGEWLAEDDGRIEALQEGD